MHPQADIVRAVFMKWTITVACLAGAVFTIATMAHVGGRWTAIFVITMWNFVCVTNAIRMTSTLRAGLEPPEGRHLYYPQIMFLPLLVIDVVDHHLWTTACLTLFVCAVVYGAIWFARDTWTAYRLRTQNRLERDHA